MSIVCLALAGAGNSRMRLPRLSLSTSGLSVQYAPPGCYGRVNIHPMFGCWTACVHMTASFGTMACVGHCTLNIVLVPVVATCCHALALMSNLFAKLLCFDYAPRCCCLPPLSVAHCYYSACVAFYTFCYATCSTPSLFSSSTCACCPTGAITLLAQS